MTPLSSPRDPRMSLDSLLSPDASDRSPPPPPPLPPALYPPLAPALPPLPLPSSPPTSVVTSPPDDVSSTSATSKASPAPPGAPPPPSTRAPVSAAEQRALELLSRRKTFVHAITKPCARRGYVICRLCDKYIWGPNGRYHIDRCIMIVRARKKALRNGLVLHSVCGIPVDNSVFKKELSVPGPRLSKVPGFVMSQSVLLEDPHSVPRDAEDDDDTDAEGGKPDAPAIEAAETETGKKGYIRCLACNREVYAPNARHHTAICVPWRRAFSTQ